MSVEKHGNRLRVLIADDDEQIIECYQGAFGRSEATSTMATEPKRRASTRPVATSRSAIAPLFTTDPKARIR